MPEFVFGLAHRALLGPSLRHSPTPVFMLERDRECLLTCTNHIRTYLDVASECEVQ
jgi:hypothetical protein